MDLAQRLIDHLKEKGFKIFANPGELNIIYVEGMNPDGTQNVDAPDLWNDIRCVVDFVEGVPRLLLCAVATTEPGRKATFSDSAKRNKGVARIAFGQFNAWKMGFHKQSKNGKNHPALVQCETIPVYRDTNRDMKRPGDSLYLNAQGINHHGTRPGFAGVSVGEWSEGCLVGLDWAKHLEFIALCKTDPRYLADAGFVFTSAVLAGNEVK